MSQETKLGIFVLVGLACLVVSIALLGDFQFQRRYNLDIYFNDVAGLPAKAKVKIAGVDVGAVRAITLEEGRAKVTVWIKNGVKIHEGAQAGIVSTGIIGSKYLELTMGDPAAPVLKDGSCIVGTNPLSLEKVVENVMERVDQIFGSFEGAGGKGMGENLNATLENLRVVSDTLRAALEDQDKKIAAIIDNVHSFTEDVAEITAANKDDIQRTIQQLSAATEKLDRILAKVDRGEGTVGALLTDEKMGKDLKATFSDLRETTQQVKQVVRRLNLVETYWDYQLRYDAKYNVYRHDAGLKVVPRPGKFYYIGGSNLGENKGEGRADPEASNTFNVLLGQQFGPAELYAGVLRSKGGLGVRVRPLWKWDPFRRLELQAEGYNFFRETPVARPKVNVGARMEITRWANLGVQLEDVYYSTAPNFFANLSIRDDDIAYILGLVGLAKP